MTLKKGKQGKVMKKMLNVKNVPIDDLERATARAKAENSDLSKEVRKWLKRYAAGQDGNAHI